MRQWLLSVSILVSLVMVALGAGYASASTAGRWIATDVGAQATLLYPAYTDVTLIGMTTNDRIFWTAVTQGNSSVRDVFEWNEGAISDLGALPKGMFPTAFNNLDAIAGTDFSGAIGRGPGQTSPPVHGYLWQNGAVTDLGTFGPYATVVSMNNRGQIIESYFPARGPLLARAALWQNGKMTDLGTLGGKTSVPDAINERGQIVGTSQTKSGRNHAFLWQNGNLTDLGTLSGDVSEAVALNGHGQVVGRYGNSNSDTLRRAFLWQNGKAVDLGRVSSDGNLPILINNRGQVIRTRDVLFGPTRGLLWQRGKTIGLGTLGGQQTYPLAINERGQIVGVSALRGSTETDPKLRAFLWQNGRMTQLPGKILYFASPMTIDPSGTHIVLGTCCPSQLLLWTYAP